jgi:hypothetical protein
LRDSAAEVVPVSDRVVTVSVAGDALLAGIGTARPATEERFTATSCTTFEGRAQAVVRSTGPAKATVTIAVEGLAPVVVTVPAEE